VKPAPRPRNQAGRLRQSDRAPRGVATDRPEPPTGSAPRAAQQGRGAARADTLLPPRSHSRRAARARPHAASARPATGSAPSAGNATPPRGQPRPVFFADSRARRPIASRRTPGRRSDRLRPLPWVRGRQAGAAPFPNPPPDKSWERREVIQ